MSTEDQTDVAEFSVLSCILQEPQCLFRVMEEITVEDFYDARHQEVYRAILSVQSDGGTISTPTVFSRARGIPIDFIESLYGYVPTTTVLSHFLGKVRDLSFLRSAKQLGSQLTHVNDKEEAEELINNAPSKIIERFLVNTSEISSGGELADSVGDSIRAKRKNPGIFGIKTGFSTFDKVVKGLKTLNLIAAETGFGKTALALQWAYNIGVKQSIPALYVNCEMGVDEIMERVVSSASGVRLDLIQTGDLQDEHMVKVDAVTEAVRNSKLFITGDQPKTINTIINYIYQYHHTEGIKVVFIDYMGEIDLTKDELRAGTYITQGMWMQQIKSVCSKLGIKAVVLAQVKGGSFGKEYGLGSIADSIQLERKSHVYAAIMKTDRWDCALKIIKNRGGATPEPIPLDFNKKTQRIEEMCI